MLINICKKKNYVCETIFYQLLPILKHFNREIFKLKFNII